MKGTAKTNKGYSKRLEHPINSSDLVVEIDYVKQAES